MRKPSFSLVGFIVFSVTLIRAAPAQEKTTAERLGYPRDAKLLIIHADDLALGHSVNEASIAALEKGAVSSGSIMVPCPWFAEIAEYARAHPDADLGLHLTLTSEWKNYRWGPESSRDRVPGLLDPAGYLWPDLPSVAKSAKPEEVEREIRAQIERATKVGIRPTHLDSHMGTLFAPAFFPVYVKVAREYRIPFFMLRLENVPPPFSKLVRESGVFSKLIRDSDIFPDAMVTVHEGIAPEKWVDFYLTALRNLKPGLTELIVHLGYDDAELQAISEDRPAFGSAWRRRDFDVMTSSEFMKALADNGITLIGWKEIKKLIETNARGN